MCVLGRSLVTRFRHCLCFPPSCKQASQRGKQARNKLAQQAGKRASKQAQRPPPSIALSPSSRERSSARSCTCPASHTPRCRWPSRKVPSPSAPGHNKQTSKNKRRNKQRRNEVTEPTPHKLHGVRQRCHRTARACRSCGDMTYRRAKNIVIPQNIHGERSKTCVRGRSISYSGPSQNMLHDGRTDCTALAQQLSSSSGCSIPRRETTSAQATEKLRTSSM